METLTPLSIERIHGRVIRIDKVEDGTQLLGKVLLEFRYPDGPEVSVVEGEVQMPARPWSDWRIERRLVERAWSRLEKYFDGESEEANIFA